MENDNNTTKYIIKTDSDKTYSLYIMEAKEYQKGKYIALFLYYDEDEFENTEKLWLNLRHRILYENSMDAVKAKIVEYASGRNEKLIFLEVQESPVEKAKLLK
jgi:hypothetical protein